MEKFSCKEGFKLIKWVEFLKEKYNLVSFPVQEYLHLISDVDKVDIYVNKK